MRAPPPTPLVLLLGLVLALAAPAAAQPAPEPKGPTAAGDRQAPENRGGEPDAVAWQPDVRSAKRYARDRAGEVSFVIVDPDDHLYGFHPHRTAPAASVFKAMLLAAYLRQHSVADRPLRNKDRELLRPMIRSSDNASATRARDIVGKQAILRLAKRAGMDDFRYDEVWGLCRISAADQARFFHLYEVYVPERHERFARRQLAGIVASQRWGVGQTRPDGWQLFFKGGWGTSTGRVNHQAAFLDRGQQRVALAVLTEFNPSHRYGIQTLEGVAERLLRDLPKLPRRR